MVLWSAPLQEQHDGLIQGYTVYYQKVDDQGNQLNPPAKTEVKHSESEDTLVRLSINPVHTAMRFPALWHRTHVFPRFLPGAYFPALDQYQLFVFRFAFSLVRCTTFACCDWLVSIFQYSTETSIKARIIVRIKLERKLFIPTLLHRTR